MTLRIEEDTERRLVRVTLDGVYDKPIIEKMVAGAREASAKKGWNILYDMRAATPGKITPADIFWFPRQHPALQSPAAATVRVASLHDARHTEVAAFWETTFRNVGLQARAFTDEAEAIAWLRE
jgi:hypothetical protein